MWWVPLRREAVNTAGSARQAHRPPTSGVIMTSTASIQSVILEATDAAATQAFYDAAFGLGDKLRVRESQAPTSGFRGYVLSLVVSQPSTVDSLIGSAVDAGATIVKAAKKSFWGYGGVIAAPDGSIWKIATSAK